MQPSEFHFLLTGEACSPVHEALYQSSKVGYSDKSQDTERFTAVTVLTLMKTTRVTMQSPSRVVLLVPPTLDKWVLDQLDKFAARTFNHLKTYAGTPKARGDMAKMIGEWFKVLFVMSRLLQLPDEPAAWTSFGFAKDDPIPDWMREGLLLS